jgi:CBS domain-containing protein
MTGDLPTVGPQQSIRDAAGQMTQRAVKALPVCEDNRLVGIITDWDVTRAVAREGNTSQEPVSGYMSTDLVTAAPDATLTEVAELMAERRVHHLLVCDGEQFAGMVHLDVEWSLLGGTFETPTATFTAPI